MPRARWSARAFAENVSQIRQAIVDFAYANGVSEPLLSDIHLAVSEAVTNAVMHAYRQHAEPGSIEVHAGVTSGWFEARVVDDGSGMTRRNDSPGVGLGLPLIHRLADQVELRPGAGGRGTELCMRFYLGDPATA
jgi:anti-sigma regulatory factor (Ser/Thr protein kinase)